MSKKYRVMQNGTYYGSYPATSPEEAINKAYNKQSAYYDFDFSQPFQVKRMSNEIDIMVEAPNER